ncbi:uncharacterized protein LOC117565549 [Drosophila albomicans]|uniref:Uncharacterized protein LOC117565549 n=1 Tax=Drosophila albomicans TaxID=7291 RepID=A0A6P8WAH3_DROAB|nr:uncharacterized protein LOC117565549 [Drosophila albomicans]
MTASMKYIIAGFCLLSTVRNIRGEERKPLQCWHCSSETAGAEDFCDVTFQEDNIPQELIKERNINLLRTCNSSINSDHERPVCRKTVEESNGKVITKRYCYYTNKADPLYLCNMTSPDKNVRRIFCEDCLEDSCNGAGSLVSFLSALLLPLLAVAN